MTVENIIKRLEVSIEFLQKDINNDIESLGWKAFLEGQLYAYKSILEELYKEKIEEVWNL